MNISIAFIACLCLFSPLHLAQAQAQAFTHLVGYVEVLNASTAPNSLQFVPRFILSKKAIKRISI